MASAFLCSKTLRSNCWAQLGALLLSFVSAIPAVAVSAMEHYPEFHLSFQGLLFLAASFCHAPVWIYIALFHGGRLVTSFSRGAAGSAPAKERSRVQEWKFVEECLAALARNPLDAGHREQLADSYLRLGALDSAISEYRKAADSLDTGPEQARLMYRAVYICVERRLSVKNALPLLRRMIRLYPRSYYAAYARRILNRYEAYESAGLLDSENADWWDSGAEPRA
ncbi:MAG: hypothetical protein VX254_05940 [Planctomycetota bacterium]|nr:hypothetical protein [Planctomycetota bacterium]